MTSSSARISSELEAELPLEQRVHVRERLVEQQQPRLEDERAGERDALRLAAGQGERGAVLPAAEPDALQRLGSPSHPLRSGTLPQSQAVADVVGDGATQQVRLLEDRGDGAADR